MTTPAPARGQAPTTRPSPATQPATMPATSTHRSGDATTHPATSASDVRPIADGLASTDPNLYKLMSLDELLDLEVTTVSKRPERLAETASAIQVITNEEIRRSGALTLPEALRLAPNLQVARVNAANWAIAARGFNGAPQSNNALSNKLLVMIDGRSVYTPLFGGVFWDMQNVLLEDVDRIEVVSGPGGTLWGANAVNGVINVVTRSARESQGLYVTGAAGTFWESYGGARYGGQISDDLYFRVYGLGWQTDDTRLPDGGRAGDEWEHAQAGFRLDHEPAGAADVFTLQGDIYAGDEGDPLMIESEGGNLLSRWTHAFADDSELVVQAYFDSATRMFDGFETTTRTYDLDLQHRLPLGRRHTILWGGGYRVARNEVDNVPALTFVPDERTLDLVNVFAQDEIVLVPDQWRLTLGAKLEHNDYSGFELQPSARLAWTPTERHAVWGAVSRAVRSPTRFDQDVDTPVVATLEEFESESLVAYELGYRVRPLDVLSLSIATFYNDYDELRSINANPAPPPIFTFDNDQEAESWGVEVAGDLQLTEWWRLRGGYTYFDRNIWATDPAVVPVSATFEGNDARNQVVLQSMLDLPRRFQLDVVARYVDALEQPAVPAYITMDVRLGWSYRNAEFSVVGQNLLDPRHSEFGFNDIPRSVYGKVTLRW